MFNYFNKYSITVTTIKFINFSELLLLMFLRTFLNTIINCEIAKHNLVILILFDGKEFNLILEKRPILILSNRLATLEVQIFISFKTLFVIIVMKGGQGIMELN